MLPIVKDKELFEILATILRYKATFIIHFVLLEVS